MYKFDPKIMNSKFKSKCKKCGKVIFRDEKIIYYPKDKEVFCFACGESDYLAFLSSVEDEDRYNNGYC